MCKDYESYIDYRDIDVCSLYMIMLFWIKFFLLHLLFFNLLERDEKCMEFTFSVHLSGLSGKF